MFGHEKLKTWVREYFTYKSDYNMLERRYWELQSKVDALYDQLGFEYRQCPGRNYAITKGAKECQQ